MYWICKSTLSGDIYWTSGKYSVFTSVSGEKMLYHRHTLLSCHWFVWSAKRQAERHKRSMEDK